MRHDVAGCRIAVDDVCSNPAFVRLDETAAVSAVIGQRRSQGATSALMAGVVAAHRRCAATLLARARTQRTATWTISRDDAAATDARPLHDAAS